MELRDTNLTMIWGCGHRRAARIPGDDRAPYCVQVSVYPCAERCGGWHWGEGPGDIHLVMLNTLEEYLDFAMTGTGEDRQEYPDGMERPHIGALTCWLELA